ncbi:hypothetical protein V8F33_011995 [Rhypophila sp. PSN 637]
MSSPAFRNVFEPQAERNTSNIEKAGASILKDSFRLSTLFLIGALVQSILFLVLPARYALLPTVILLLHALITTITEVRSPAAWATGTGKHLVPYKVSAQIPNQSYNPSANEPSIFGSTPADKGIVVLHLGLRFNHPLGVLCPGGKEMGEHKKACDERVMAHMESSDDDFGCLGISSWQAVDEGESHSTMLSVYYFRDMDGLNRFAHDAVHRKAWDYYAKEFYTKQTDGVDGWKGRHIGVYHEAFYAPPGMWETIYANMQPTMLGRAMAPVKNQDTGKTEWVGTLVDARHKALRSQWGRMGRSVGDRYPPGAEGGRDGYGTLKGDVGY